ncbi:MAG: GNAT family protein [Bacillus sp. (in: firmicutes)]
MKIEEIYGDLPTLETERLILRKLTPADLEDMYVYGSNPDVTKYVTWDTHQTVSDTNGFLQFILSQYEKKQIAPWGMEYKENSRIIGTIDFVWWHPDQYRAEIGYALSQEYWGKGIMTEAAKEVVQFGFEKMGLTRIQAKCFTENTGSARVMEKAGMTFEGIMRKGIFVKGESLDLKVYSVLKEEFLAK